MTTPRTPRWYAGAFVLIEANETQSSHGDYAHPRVTIARCWEHAGAQQGAWSMGSRMPADLTAPHHNSDRLLTFEFQQNVGRGFTSGDETPAPAWLNVREDAFTGHSYGGKVTNEIRLDGGRIRRNGDLQRKLSDVDKALARLSRRRAELQEHGLVFGCEVSQLVCALRTAWRLPVLFVVYRANGKKPVAFLNPDLSVQDTAQRLHRLDEQERERAESAKEQTT
jgi:hypothetical protein